MPPIDMGRLVSAFGDEPAGQAEAQAAFCCPRRILCANRNGSGSGGSATPSAHTMTRARKRAWVYLGAISDRRTTLPGRSRVPCSKRKGME